MKNPSIIKNYGSTNFISGIRAFAALAVVLVHSGGAGLRELGRLGNNLVDFCHVGPYIFFVISGFSVANSFVNSDSYWQFISKRIWRIAPIYYFWLIVYLSFGLLITGNTPRLENVFFHFTFLSFLNIDYANSIIGVEWSIPIEVFWYFLIPLILLYGRSWNNFLIIFLSSFVFYSFAIVSPDLLFPDGGKNAPLLLHWSPYPYIISFVLGIFAFKLRDLKINWGLFSYPILCVIFIATLSFNYDPKYVQKIFTDDLIFVSVATFLVILVGSNTNSLFKVLFCNRIALFLGGISYGIYLSHSFVLVLLSYFHLNHYLNKPVQFFIVAMLSTLISILTYYAIEKPLSNFGAKRKVLI